MGVRDGKTADAEYAGGDLRTTRMMVGDSVQTAPPPREKRGNRHAAGLQIPAGAAIVVRAVASVDKTPGETRRAFTLESAVQS
jgi:hypothetical protein